MVSRMSRIELAMRAVGPGGSVVMVPLLAVTLRGAYLAESRAISGAAQRDRGSVSQRRGEAAAG
jgi:hypothetical protein